VERERHLIDLRDVVLGNTSRLRFVIRFSNCPRIHDESVSDHSFYVAIYSYLIGLALVANGTKLDLGRMLGKALLHDVDECFSGDFIRMFKHSTPELKEQIDRACGSFMTKYCADITQSDKLAVWIYGSWFDSKTDVEGAVVAFADYLSVLSYIHQEIDLGNKRMERQLPELRRFHEGFVSRKEEFGFLEEYIDQAGKILKEMEDASPYETIGV
jgi:5'-deoxynucleotidase YfbR-like HD superfamily hydrolase